MNIRKKKMDLDMNDDAALSSKILDFLKVEIAKDETKKKLKWFIEPIFSCIVSSVLPYALGILVILFLIIACQGYIIANMHSLLRMGA
jgi:hypothetical protein